MASPDAQTLSQTQKEVDSFAAKDYGAIHLKLVGNPESCAASLHSMTIEAAAKKPKQLCIYDGCYKLYGHADHCDSVDLTGKARWSPCRKPMPPKSPIQKKPKSPIQKKPKSPTKEGFFNCKSMQHYVEDTSSLLALADSAEEQPIEDAVPSGETGKPLVIALDSDDDDYSRQEKTVGPPAMQELVERFISLGEVNGRVCEDTLRDIVQKQEAAKAEQERIEREAAAKARRERIERETAEWAEKNFVTLI